MGRIKRGGYIFKWWIGDHGPRHVHVYDSDNKFLGRVVVDTKAPLDEWQPPLKVTQIIEQLENEGRL